MNTILENTYVCYFTGALAAVLIIFLGAKSLSEFGLINPSQPAYNTISVSGTGEVTGIPDVATFSYSVTEQATTVVDAQTKATEKNNTALALIKAAGIDEKDIKTTDYNIAPQYDYVQPVCTANYCPGGKQVLKGYQVIQTISVKVRDLSKAGDILSKLGGVGVQNLSDLQFSIDDPEALQTEARAKAIEDAKTQAEALAKSLGVSLKKVVGFYDNVYDVPMYESRAYSGDMKRMAAVAPTPELPQGQTKIVSKVSVTYEIK